MASAFTSFTYMEVEKKMNLTNREKELIEIGDKTGKVTVMDLRMTYRTVNYGQESLKRLVALGFFKLTTSGFIRTKKPIV